MNEADRVYLVTHLKNKSEDLSDYKIIGVFSTEDLARQAIRDLQKSPGFSDYPEGFECDPCVLNQVYWRDGFVTV